MDWHFVFKYNVGELLQGQDLLNIACVDKELFNYLSPVISRNIIFRHPVREYKFLFYSPLKLKVGGFYGHQCPPAAVSCRFEFNIQDIPSNLTQLTLGYSFGLPLEKHFRNFHSLTHLALGVSYAHSIYFLPHSLTHLTLRGCMFANSLHIYFLPPKLIYLELQGHTHNVETVFPDTLETFLCFSAVELSDTSRHSLAHLRLKVFHGNSPQSRFQWDDHLPDSITDLDYKRISPLPSNLRKFRLRGVWVKRLPLGLLELSCYGARIEKVSSLPSSLTHLTLNYCTVSSHLWETIFSLPNLTYLRLKSDVRSVEPFVEYKVVTLPPKLTTLIVKGWRYYYMFAKYSRPSLESFTLRSDGNNLQYTAINGYFYHWEWNSYTISLLESMHLSSGVLEQLPPNLKKLHIYGSNFPLPPLPSTLEVLEISNKDYDWPLPTLPPTLKYLSVQSKSTLLPALPPGLISLSLGKGDHIVLYPQLPPLPRSLRVLELKFELGENTVTEFPPFLRKLVITARKHPLPPLPLTLEYISITPPIDSICHLK